MALAPSQDEEEKNPIYQTINFVGIVTVILLNDLRMLLQRSEFNFTALPPPRKKEEHATPMSLHFMPPLHYPSLIPVELCQATLPSFLSFVSLSLFDPPPCLDSSPRELLRFFP
jgi:hypothetical protein